MSAHAKSFIRVPALAGLALACSLAFPSFAQAADPLKCPETGAEIARQGNLALQQIRHEAIDSFRATLPGGHRVEDASLQRSNEPHLGHAISRQGNEAMRELRSRQLWTLHVPELPNPLATLGSVASLGR